MKRDQRQRGTAAIEMVIVLLFAFVLLNGLVLFGRLTWHLTALQKSVDSTVRIVSALPVERLSGTGAAASMRLFGDASVRAALRSAGTDLEPPPETITVKCNDNACFTLAVNKVDVTAALIFEDTLFGDPDGYLTGGILEIVLSSSLNYVP
ncbi:hypothetical protein IP91_03891 [Pseudoduganella lurida]|uniref:Pilus assembly protein n=1 Tax=Pseudoduganella lurida TaxID=1036180 RepID=A0A562R1X5_9BURK|nr:hypothetical protein [Pseudoduganella lurida]TWI63051.1 hypothetical protein IP91_03891 [Pseudoduganella lurida]